MYRDWADRGAMFHYVSASPWQLYHCLSELVHESGFPPGTFHLRAVRLRDPSILRLFLARRRAKRKVIRSILRMFPDRRFVLVGDSGEKDPEKLERDLMGQIPKKEWIALSHRMIQHGRRYCTARKPKCDQCPLESICPRIGVETK